mgnify:FL=1
MREMGFMEKLLDGVEVEWTAINEVLNMRAGQHISASNINDYPDDEYQYPCFGGNGVRGFVKYNSHDGKYLLIGRQGALCGNVQRTDGKFYATEHAVVVSSKRAINLDWAFHLLTMMNLNQYASKSAQPGLAVGKIQSLKIPIPCPKNPKKSLEIQAEIVRILDAMTAHTAELTAELTARKKQYDYYRDKLLSFEDDVYEFPLSDICTSIADGDHQAPPQTSTGINFVTISNISKNGFIDFSKTKYVPDDYYKNLASKRKPRFGDVLYTVVGSIGIPVFIDFEKEFTFQRHVAILRFKTELVNPKYVFHFMRSRIFFNKANSVAMGAAQKTITLGTLGKLKISLPSLERQNNIVAILDKFDSLANSITDGLPREIELRQKQYAYYRDLLLSFPAAQAA